MAARKIEDEYELKEELGKGSFSVVHRAISKATKEEVAIKVIQKSLVAVDDKTKKRLATEVEILRKVNHPNIIPLKDIIDTTDKLYLVMELVSGGELFDKIVEKGFYSEKEAASVVRKVISAIQYLHSINIAHRDLKPENLLLKKGDDTHVMISDFGLSRILGEDSLMSTACGTPYYVAPEILKANPYTKDVDMWSIGVITYFLLAGFPPFMGDNLPEIVEQIVNADYSFPSPYWDEVSTEAKDFVKKLLVVEPEKRLTADQCLAHPWLVSQTLNEKPLNADKQKMANHKQLRKLNSFANPNH